MQKKSSSDPIYKKILKHNQNYSYNIEAQKNTINFKKTQKNAYINNNQLNHIKKILFNSLNYLKNKINGTVQHIKNETPNLSDLSDRASQEEELNLKLKTFNREKKLIKKIKKAIIRLNSNYFGYCKICGIEIGIKRLKIQPTTTLCIDCKTLYEIKKNKYSKL
ncbi:RNA polymerase-binding protein DksA [Candidatus Legionella polyplacis]|uniref:RNA polymerase-binding protein DksA n=1 Tax=Candidatus Legionella polyplacis TaxID=2005262 RepID=A0ABZ2GWH6_9GAMM